LPTVVLFEAGETRVASSGPSVSDTLGKNKSVSVSNAKKRDYPTLTPFANSECGGDKCSERCKGKSDRFHNEDARELVDRKSTVRYTTQGED
jgi:hypothetical protein